MSSTKYTIESIRQWLEKVMSTQEYIAVKSDFSAVYYDYNEVPSTPCDLYLYTENKRLYCYEVYLKEKYAMYTRRDNFGGLIPYMRKKGNPLADVVVDYYARKAKSVGLLKEKQAAEQAKKEAEEKAEKERLLAEKKAKEAEKQAKREAKENAKLADCKTFNVDYFNHDSLFDAITEIAERLLKGQYSNLLLNDTILLEYRTKYKSENKPYTVNIQGLQREYDDKYGDLWEDLMDRIENEVLNIYIIKSYNDNSAEIEERKILYKWLEKFADWKKQERELTENDIFVYDMLLLYNKEYIGCNIGDKVKVSIGNKLYSLLYNYFMASYCSKETILNKIKEVKDEFYYQEHKEEIDKQRAEEAAKKKAEEDKRKAEEAARKAICTEQTSDKPVCTYLEGDKLLKATKELIGLLIKSNSAKGVIHTDKGDVNVQLREEGKYYKKMVVEYNNQKKECDYDAKADLLTIRNLHNLLKEFGF